MRPFECPMAVWQRACAALLLPKQLKEMAAAWTNKSFGDGVRGEGGGGTPGTPIPITVSKFSWSRVDSCVV